MPMLITRHSVTSLLSLLIVVAMACAGPAAPRAQSGNPGDGHGLHHDWYRELKTRSGWSCCNGDERHGDCRPVQARQRGDGQWEAYVDRHWQEVPADAILHDELNKAPLHSHICERAGFIYCFLRARTGS